MTLHKAKNLEASTFCLGIASGDRGTACNSDDFFHNSKRLILMVRLVACWLATRKITNNSSAMHWDDGDIIEPRRNYRWYWPTRLHFATRQIYLMDSFVRLAIDEESSASERTERVEKWVKQILKLPHLDGNSRSACDGYGLIAQFLLSEHNANQNNCATNL